MIVNTELAAYLVAVTDAIARGKVDIPLTNTCPECGVTIDTYLSAAGDDPHLVIELTGDNFAMIVGCEGYWVVNPNLVGINSPGWSDGTALGDQVTGVHDATCPDNCVNTH